MYPKFPAAYGELAKRLGTANFVWCSIIKDEAKEREKWRDRVEWILDVPDDEILCLTDIFIWNKIIDFKTYPQSLRTKLWKEVPQDVPSKTDWVEGKLNEYHNMPEPADGWWSQLFLKDTNAEDATVLVRHPIPESWISTDGRKGTT